MYFVKRAEFVVYSGALGAEGDTNQYMRTGTPFLFTYLYQLYYESNNIAYLSNTVYVYKEEYCTTPQSMIVLYRQCIKTRLKGHVNMWCPIWGR